MADRGAGRDARLGLGCAARARRARSSRSSGSVAIWSWPSVVAPLVARAVAVELDPVAVGVGQVQRLADQVVGGAVQRPARLRQSRQREREVKPRGEEDREVVEAGGAAVQRGRGRCRRAARPARARPATPSASVPSSRLGAPQADRVLVERARRGEVGHGQADRAQGGVRDRSWRSAVLTGVGVVIVATLRRPRQAAVPCSTRSADELGQPVARLGVGQLAVVGPKRSWRLGHRAARRRARGRRRCRAPCAGGPGPTSRRSR